MSFDLNELIWLFPIAFMLHDFEELILFEPWLKKNAGSIMERIHKRVPAFIERQLTTVLHKSTIEFAIPIFLIFLLTILAALLAAEFDSYPFFLIASSLFFLHGFMHIGQAIIMRRYIPALITSVIIAIPYGVMLFPRLLAAGIVDDRGLVIYFIVAIVLAVPFILGMHVVGEILYKWIIKVLVR